MKEFDLIGDVGVEITDVGVSEMLKEANGDDVTFYIATLGGSFYQGNTIRGKIESYKGKTKAIIIGHTASAGTIIALGCDSVECKAPFLIHNAIDPRGGNQHDLRKKLTELERDDKLMVAIYKKKTGLDESVIFDLMAKEDWLMPEEAKKYGFVDEVGEASRMVAYGLKDKLSEMLITKLENKMKLFKKDKEAKAYPLVLKDGNIIAMAGDTLAEGIEIEPMGAMTLEDGEYELSDGRIIVISGGIVQEVKEVQAKEEEPTDVEAIVASVSEVVIAEVDKVRVEFDKKLAGISSKHTPPKGTAINAKADDIRDMSAKVQDKIQAKLEESRKKIIEERSK